MVCNTFKAIVRLFILIIASMSGLNHAVAAEPIGSAFGQSLGAVFDPTKATDIIQSNDTLSLRFHPPASIPVFSEYNALAAPLTYRIYAITATGVVDDPKECRGWAGALFHIIMEKYADDGNDTAIFAFDDATGWRLHNERAARWINVRCMDDETVSITYVDDAERRRAQDEQQEWNRLYAKYEKGQYEEVLSQLVQLADHGNMQAQVVLGLMHRYGQGVSQNAVLAENYYMKAAQRGYPQAEFNLGTFYLSQTRHQEAEPWLKKAAESGYAKSQYNLGQLYASDSRLRDLSEAFRWYQRAAEQGHVDAQYNTCRMYSAGDGVARNEVEAWRWCDIAATAGHEKAAQNRDHIANRMTVQQVESARQLSAQWLENRSKP
jgi:TPR repeat protein